MRPAPVWVESERKGHFPDIDMAVHKSSTVSHQVFLLDTGSCIVFERQHPGHDARRHHVLIIRLFRASCSKFVLVQAINLYCAVRICLICDTGASMLRTITRAPSCDSDYWIVAK
jgi:hypothetical protein